MRSFRSKTNSSHGAEKLSHVRGKPAFEISANTVVNFKSDFSHKLLCDGKTFSLGSACTARCTYHYVENIVRKNPQIVEVHKTLDRLGLKFQDVTVRRKDAVDILREQLTNEKPRWVDLNDAGVIFTSPLVDPASTIELPRQTAEACRVILELTSWQIRILTKGCFLRHLVAEIPPKFQDRLILGHLTGILDDNTAKCVESGTALVSKRIQDHRWLQDNGFKTFGMVCPSLPQADPAAFVEQALDLLRAEQCEHIWGEVINLRGDSLTNTLASLYAGGFNDEAHRLAAVCGVGSRERWEQ